MRSSTIPAARLPAIARTTPAQNFASRDDACGSAAHLPSEHERCSKTAAPRRLRKDTPTAGFGNPSFDLFKL
jgi:hypothetical protein